MITDTPCLVAFLFGVGDLIGLAIYTGFHDVIPTDSTVINMDIPGPQRHCIPFLDFESLLRVIRISFDHCFFCSEFDLKCVNIGRI